MVSEDPAANQLPLVVETLSKDVLPSSLTRHIDVFLLRKNEEKSNVLNISYDLNVFLYIKTECSLYCIIRYA